MGLTAYNLSEKWWAISLTYYKYIYIYIYIYIFICMYVCICTYPKVNVSHNHRLELVIPWLNSRIYVVGSGQCNVKCKSYSRKIPFKQSTHS